ncbi:Ig-like domain-containing protein [Staphylococcus hyicus]|uniref:Ig-like domain-containing protein n=1 Tax=Staphylococcus hyicus TaxID=1284 RepID=A0ACD5FNZ6_STAHY|nr:Ig-like domain-containing protein [Staphylococcus hyicus]MDP4462656.1 Ig-like domain-containing protein [Staphylococcus hyicus]
MEDEESSPSDQDLNGDDDSEPEVESSVKIQGRVKTVVVDGTVQLSVTHTPKEASVTYDSLQKDIATVNESGLVTGVKEGLATITATVNDKIDKITINVKAKPEEEQEDPHHEERLEENLASNSDSSDSELESSV